ncbi:hypothetical protein ACWCO9_06660, partial [Streptomyces sp. NPDC001937]
MYGSLVGRLTAALALIWLLAAPVPAAADNCSYASIGDGGGNAAVATTGDGHCQAGVSFELLDKVGSVQWPCNAEAPEGT